MRDQDELIFLGFGGARFNVVSQYYPTGGILFRMNGVQVHLDPGPAAILYTQLAQVNPEETRVVAVTHDHTDHVVDVPVMLEAMHAGNMAIKVGTLLATPDYIAGLRDYYRGLPETIVGLRPGEKHTIHGQLGIHGQPQQQDIKVVATPAMHDDKVPTIGFKFYAGDYCIGFTADTEVFPAFVPTYADCDILVCNLLRPENYHCDRHMTTNEVLPYLEDLRQHHALKAVVLTHLGARWGSDRFKPMVVPQMQKMKARLNCPVLPAAFGLKVRVADLIEGREPQYAIYSLKVKLLEFLKTNGYFHGKL